MGYALLDCSTQRATRAPQDHEVLLDKSDRLDWTTLCKCDFNYAVPRGELKNHVVLHNPALGEIGEFSRSLNGVFLENCGDDNVRHLGFYHGLNSGCNPAQAAAFSWPARAGLVLSKRICSVKFQSAPLRKGFFALAAPPELLPVAPPPALGSKR